VGIDMGAEPSLQVADAPLADSRRFGELRLRQGRSEAQRAHAGAEPVVVTRHRFASLILPPCPVRPATRWPLGGCSSWRSEAAAASMERHQPLVMEET